MQSTNTKNLTIRQLQRLIANNGLAENYDKARAKGRPTEYCLESLKASLNDKLTKSQAKYLKSDKAVTDQINSYVSVFPPAVPKSFTKPVEKRVDKPNYLFQFSKPLWIAEKLTLDERISIFGKGA